MKYIRTKDEIIDLTTLPNLDINDRGDITWYNDAEKYGYMIKYEDIIKQADTIVELCDELVEYGNRPIVISQTTVIHGRMSGKTPIIYGAIWTEWGLKYVAKMNDKGELELL